MKIFLAVLLSFQKDGSCIDKYGWTNEFCAPGYRRGSLNTFCKRKIENSNNIKNSLHVTLVIHIRNNNRDCSTIKLKIIVNKAAMHAEC